MAKKGQAGLAKASTEAPQEIATQPSSLRTRLSNLFTIVYFSLFLGLLLVIAGSLLTLALLFSDRIYPGVFIASIDVGGLTKNQARDRLTQELNRRLSTPLELTLASSTPRSSSGQVVLELAGVQNHLNIQKTIDEAFNLGHNRLYLPPVNLSLGFTSAQNLEEQIRPLADQINQPSLDSTLKVNGKSIDVTPSQEGTVIDQPKLTELVLAYINNSNRKLTQLPMKRLSPKIDYQKALALKKRLDEIGAKPLVLSFKDQTFSLDLPALVPLIDFKNPQVESGVFLNRDKTLSHISQIAAQIDRPVKEPLFQFDPRLPNKVSQFSPPAEGRKLDQERTFDLIARALAKPGQNTIELPVAVVEPKNKLTNNLGIKELIGQGASNFEGSIENRIFNLKLAASRINGVVVSPGETFSFNNTIGDVTAATGYKQAYVIKSGRTVLDDGGGVCQVSTTLFRAVLNAGLPVVARTAHAYRVHYYENGGYPPGLDATTFYPTVDFRFKNDTPASILIQSYTEGLNLYVNLYGTSDGRLTTVSKPVITSQTPPPPELRQEDPTLPKGEVKQVDFAAWGANVYFTRQVANKNGDLLINETFRSNYRPWQAVYLVGTKQ